VKLAHEASVGQYFQDTRYRWMVYLASSALMVEVSQMLFLEV
jgi:hypothetical protein